MRVLSLDTSSSTLSCALVELSFAQPALAAGRILAESLHPPPAKAGDLLPQALLDLCARAGFGLADIDAVVVGLGPGSFTGLRVGLACAKALAWARQVPLVGGSSLAALAHAAAQQGGAEGRLLIPTAEARKGELAFEVFRGAAVVAPLRVVRARELPALVAALGEPVWVFGPGAVANAPELAELPDQAQGPAELPRVPPAASLVDACAAALRGARFDEGALFALAPDYHQPSAAEVALSEGRVGKLPKGG